MKIKEIILIGHAKVGLSDNMKIDSSKVNYWVDRYNFSSLSFTSKPSKETCYIVNKADYLCTSTLLRTINSAKYFEKEVDENNELFNEVGMPSIYIPWLKFKVKNWLIILKLLLFAGKGKGKDALKVSKFRAKKATLNLLKLSEEHNRVVLIGHTGMNNLIYKVLLRQGWELISKTPSDDWGTYRFQVKKET